MLIKSLADTRIAHLGTDMRVKLKAAYTLVEQLYSGSQRVISTAAYNKPAPTLIKETLEKLGMLPARIAELKRAAARAGALTALIRAKAWIPDLEVEDIIKGYPGVKEDGSNFENDDLWRLTKQMRPAASKLADDTDLSHFQPFYDAEGKRQPANIHEVEELVPPIRKHTYAPDINPSNLIHEEAVFQALTGIDWSTADFQRVGRDEEVPTRTGPQPSNRRDEES